MKFDRLVALLPCQGIEDFDLKRREEDAEQLLSAWSTLWHPALLAAVQSLPSWSAADSPPPDPAGHLVIVPDCCLGLLPEDWLPRAEEAGACVLKNLPDREEMVAAALGELDAAEVDPELAADFLALGYCHLQVELLTRKLRYSSNLDEGGLRTAALAAAGEAMAGNAAAARGHLQSAFDRLHEAREYLYPTETRLLDLTLLAHGTFGEPLRAELSGRMARNVLCSGEVLGELAQREPETLDALKEALTAGRATLVGGEFSESPLPLLDPEAIALHLARGLGVYERHLGRRPTMFGRRRFGLTPALPQILERFGFTAAFHCTLDDGRFPTGNQGRIQWEGLDGTTIEAIGSVPLDAGRAESFLQLAETLSDAMGIEQAGTIVFAHWPGRASRWYEDLRRIAAYGSVLGTFSTMGDYFEQTGMVGQYGRFQPDEYRSPYLKQDVAGERGDPISRWVRYFRRRAAFATWQTLDTMAACVAGRAASGVDETTCEAERLAAGIEDSINANDACAALDEQLAKLPKEPLAELARSLAGPTNSTQSGCLIVNPWSFSRQAKPASGPVVDVPAMGFAWQSEPNEPLAPQAGERKGWFGLGRTKTPPPLAEERVLRNEFCEIHFDPNTGAIRSISDYRSRDPRLAQQIALRLPRGGAAGGEEQYSIMAADDISVTSVGPAMGEMVCRGRLMDRAGRRVAGFRQTTRLWRGSRVIEMLIDLDIDRLPDANPWDSYYGVRFAWKDETAEVHRSVNLADVPTELTQFESPHYVDIRRGKQQTTLICGGLPYHRRFGRKLDTLLVVRGETARSFRLGIGIDVPQPMAAAMELMAPPLVLSEQPLPRTPTGWFFHLDCRNVVATHWATVAGGFRVRLLETEGRNVRVGLRSFRAVASARKLNPGEMQPVDLAAEGDRVEVPVGAYQWVEVDVQFQ